MIGDTLDGFHLTWHEWMGGRDGSGRVRSCVGTCEHIGRRTVLIRRPRGGLVVRRISRDIIENGRVIATPTGTGRNVLRDWLEQDDAADRVRAAQVAEGRTRRAAQVAAHAAEQTARAAAYADDPDAIPF